MHPRIQEGIYVGLISRATAQASRANNWLWVEGMIILVKKKKLKLRIRLNLTRYVEMWNMIKSFESQSQPCQLPWPSQGRGKIKNEDVLKVQINNNIIQRKLLSGVWTITEENTASNKGWGWKKMSLLKRRGGVNCLKSPIARISQEICLPEVPHCSALGPLGRSSAPCQLPAQLPPPPTPTPWI